MRIPSKATGHSKETKSVNSSMLGVIESVEKVNQKPQVTDSGDIREQFDVLLHEEKRTLALLKNLKIKQGGDPADIKTGKNRFEVMEGIPIYF